MTKAQKKQVSKKAKVTKPVNVPTPNAAQVELDNALKNSDAAIIITANKGNVEVRGIKNINYAYQAKGLLTGALHSYLIVPISTALRVANQANIKMYASTLTEIKKAVGIEDETPKEKTNK